jgi:hypothetical protein
MNAAIEGVIHTRVYTRPDGRVAIEQANDAIVLTAQQVLAVIKELHVCYDYCATWKDANPE